ncbi:flagellar biosynthesis anti-sigma factor FlgM [Shewanella sp. SR44-3]|uniref:flagellar biosynthesis anti-sigma factor FlgM n=1 Tax=unclassified Shewanella TaxID=196818 RepID=UPI0015FD3573|nr:flagellar biosynthesis anti-sigma factor FlgM [Shewanella sp. SR44-3]MBB1268382.1 flagellar biosynthesis anti-sigma factor FlgM [Shewanella sp. SR44-3]
MEIQKIHSALSAEIGSNKGKQAPAQAQSSVVTAAPKQATISKDWQLLEKSHDALQALDDVDTDKVNALRESLKSGAFKLDLEQIAEKMLNQHG